MKSLQLTSRLRHREPLLKQEAEGTTVLLRLDGGQYYSLDDIGSRAWELCDGNRTVLDIAAVISSEYEASQETIQNDLLVLFTDLANENLLEEN